MSAASFSVQVKAGLIFLVGERCLIWDISDRHYYRHDLKEGAYVEICKAQRGLLTGVHESITMSRGRSAFISGVRCPVLYFLFLYYIYFAMPRNFSTAYLVTVALRQAGRELH